MWYMNYLFHHGIKGQKWGVRRYQDSSGRLTAAGKQRNKDRKVNKTVEDYIKMGKATVDNLPDYHVGALTTMTTAAGEKFVSGLTNGHDFDWQEVTPYVEYANEYISTSKAIADYPEQAHRIKDDTFNVEHSQGRTTTDDLIKCNPGFGEDGTTQNCAKCSAALEVRMRGYDISAGRQTYPSSVDSQSLWFKDAKRVEYDYDIAEEALRSYGAKTSGTLSFQYPGDSGGHAVHWTNDVNGKFEIQDGQNGKTFDSISSMMETYGGDTDKSISTFRLDNCEMNLEAMEQDSVIRLVGPKSKVKNKFTGRVVDTW